MLAIQPGGLARARSRTSRAVLISVLTLSGGVLSLYGSAHAAETLHQALASAYRHNPGLLAERKAVEATDEGVSQARAGFRPQVVLNADAGHQDLATEQTVLGGSGIIGGSLALSLIHI